MKLKTHKKRQIKRKVVNGGDCGCGKVNLGFPSAGGFLGLFENSKNQSKSSSMFGSFFGDDTSSQEPMNTQQPMNQYQPMSQQPMNTQQPMSQQPMSQQPMSQQPMNTQPMNTQPMNISNTVPTTNTGYQSVSTPYQTVPMIQALPPVAVGPSVQSIVNLPNQTFGGSAFEIPTLRRANRSAIKRAELPFASQRSRYKPSTNLYSNIASVTSRPTSLGRSYSSSSIQSLLADAEREGREAAESRAIAKEALRVEKQIIEQGERMLNGSSSNVGLLLGGQKKKRRTQKKRRSQKKRHNI